MAATYLVTGGAGFIGRQLCDELLRAGHKVRVIDSLVPQVHGDVEPPLPAGVEFLEGDLRDAGLVRRGLQGVDGVFHLAAEVGVGQSMYEIARYVGGNDLATAVLLENMIDEPGRRLVVASSMSVYGEGLYRTPDGTPRGGGESKHAHTRPPPCSTTRTSTTTRVGILTPRTSARRWTAIGTSAPARRRATRPTPTSRAGLPGRTTTRAIPPATRTVR